MNWKTRLNLLTLGGGFIIFFFGLVGGIAALALSFVSQSFGIKQWLVNQPRGVIFAIVVGLVFLIMSGVIFWVESFLIEVYNYLAFRFGKSAVGILSIGLFCALILGIYLIMPGFLVFVRDYFWL
jgi:hypothetical protein